MIKSLILDIPLFSGSESERSKLGSIRPTEAIAEGAIANEEDRSKEAAAALWVRKRWNIE